MITRTITMCSVIAHIRGSVKSRGKALQFGLAHCKRVNHAERNETPIAIQIFPHNVNNVQMGD